MDGAPVEEAADEEQDAEGAAPDFNAALPDEEFPYHARPAMNICADNLTSGAMDEIQATRKVYAKLHGLQAALKADVAEDVAAGRVKQSRTQSLQQAANALKSVDAVQRIVTAGEQVEHAEQHADRSPIAAYAVPTGSQPLSMYSAAQWAMCFPILFPYGDGVFGLPRQDPLSFQQCAGMHLLREELVYQVTPAIMSATRRFSAAAAARDGQHPNACEANAAEDGAGVLGCSCTQCARACQIYVPPKQPRWGADRELIFCNYDSWRRMEQIKRATAHVQRSGYHEKLEIICNASAVKVEAAIACVGEKGSVRGVLRSPECDPNLKQALSELMVFTSEVVGADGVRAKLRHEQNGFGLMFGGSGAFLTPNMSDVRNPIVVLLHGGGMEERYEVSLVED